MEPEKKQSLTKSFPEIEMEFQRSKTEIWQVISDKTSAMPQKTIDIKSRRLSLLATAALILLLIGITGFMRFYSETIGTATGEQLTVTLPDQSEVRLNAVSTITFHPHWWKVSREVTLQGEAYFDVKKGNRFDVKTTNGTVKVLGTTFNVYSRNDVFEVTCRTGKVSVNLAGTDEPSILTADQKILVREGVKTTSDAQSGDAIAWTQNQFSFTATPAYLVFQELERQFDITIASDEPIKTSYTGNFPRDIDHYQALEIVCQPLGLQFNEERAGHYKVSKD